MGKLFNLNNSREKVDLSRRMGKTIQIISLLVSDMRKPNLVVAYDTIHLIHSVVNICE